MGKILKKRDQWQKVWIGCREENLGVNWILDREYNIIYNCGDFCAFIPFATLGEQQQTQRGNLLH